MTKSSLAGAETPEGIAWYEEGKCYVNLAGIYNYLEQPYYFSQDYENADTPIRPTCEEMLDAYITPLFLEKARRAGLKVPAYYLSNGYFEPPVVIDSMNPFISRSAVIRKSGREKSIGKSMTRNYTYAFSCQEIKNDSTIVYFRSILGWCRWKKYRDLSQAVWNTFHIPLAKIRLVVEADGEALLSDISFLPMKSLSKTEREYIEEHVKWQK